MVKIVNIINNLKKEITQISNEYKLNDRINIFSLIYIFFCWISLSTLESSMPVPFRLACMVICFIGGQCREETKKFVAKRFKNNMILLILFELYVTFALCGLYFIDTKGEYSFCGSLVAYAIISFLWCRIFAQTITWIISCCIKVDKVRELNNYWKKSFILFGVGTLCSVVYLIAFNPAITSVDSQGLYMWAKEFWDESFTMPDMQPPAYVLLLGLLIRVWDNITFLVILQVLLFWGIFTDAILFFYKKGVSKFLLAGIYLFIVFSYNNQLQLITLWKDIPFTACMMLLTLQIVKLILDYDAYRTSLTFYIGLFSSLLGVGLLRQNGILAVAAIVIILPILYKKNFRVIVTCCLVVVTIMFIKGPVYKFHHVTPQPSTKYVALGNDILYSYFLGKETRKEVEEIALRFIEGEKHRENVEYTPYLAEYWHPDLSDYSLLEFLKTYFLNFIDHPKDTLVALLKRTEIIWSVSKNSEEITLCTQYIGEKNDAELRLYPLRKENVLTRVFSAGIMLLKKTPTVYIICWRPGLFHILIIALMVSLFARKKKECRINCVYLILPFIPIILNVLALFIAAFSPDYRFYWPSVIISLLLLMYYVTVEHSNFDFTENEETQISKSFQFVKSK